MREHETTKQAGVDYGDEEVRRAIVHTRQDVVLLMSLLSSLNEQLSWIIALLALILLALVLG